MTPQEFCYWLNGYFDLAGDDTSMTDEQIQCVKEHLELVFQQKINPVEYKPFNLSDTAIVC